MRGSCCAAGWVATFSITVTNAAGGGTAHDAIVNDPLPAGVDYLASQGGVCGETGTSCSLGDIAPGTSVTFTISYAVGTSPSLMVVHNEATVTSPDRSDCASGFPAPAFPRTRA